eukprot:86022_1
MHYTIKTLIIISCIYSIYGYIKINDITNAKQYVFSDWGEHNERTMRALVDRIKNESSLDIECYQLTHYNTVIDTNNLDQQLIDVSGIEGIFWGDDGLILELKQTVFPISLPTRIPISECTFRREEITLSQHNEIGEIELTPQCT